jgi:YD repeat-containing protein
LQLRYTYDNWGNLLQTQPMTGLLGNNFTVTANGNNQLSNLTYDAASEVTQDQYSNSFSYDAEGRILSGGTGTYVYDGSGNRVKKTMSGTTTLYWPGAGGVLDESNSTCDLTSFNMSISEDHLSGSKRCPISPRSQRSSKTVFHCRIKLEASNSQRT